MTLLATQPRLAPARLAVASADGDNSSRSMLARELADVRAIAKLAREQDAKLTYGLPGFEKTRSQVVGDALTPHALVGWGILATLLGLFGGGLAAIIAENDFRATIAQQFAIWGKVAGGFAALEGIAVAVGLSARQIAKHQRTRRITPENVTPLVGTFESGVGRNKAAAGSYVTTLLNNWHAKQVLTPPARELLEKVQKDTSSLPTEDRTRVFHMRQLCDLVDGPGAVSEWTVKQLRQVLDCFPAGERKDLTALVCDIIRQSGRKLEYAGEHALYDLAKVYE